MTLTDCIKTFNFFRLKSRMLNVANKNLHFLASAFLKAHYPTILSSILRAPA